MPVMRKSLHGSFSRATMLLINAEQYSSDKGPTHPTISEANIHSFAENGKICKKGSLLECEKRFSITKQKQRLLMLMLNFV